jgi:general secretion pathway protein E/type IV pilus assembly protein PilB
VNISDELLKLGLISPQDRGDALRLHESEGIRLDQAHIRLGHVEERRLIEVIGEQLALPVVELSGIRIEPEILKSLPSKFVHRKRLLPISRENGTLRVVTSDAFDLYAFDEVRMITGLEIEPALAPGDEIDRVIKEHYGLAGDTIDEMVGEGAGGEHIELLVGEASSTEDLLDMAQEASVIKLVNEIILEAVAERASDVHIEPYEHELSIRYRIDGLLQEAALPPQIHRFQAAIVSRIKILASLNIAEKRLPQDGRIKFQVGGSKIDVRVSVIPMLYGEGIVMRLLDQSNALFTLPELGMDDETFARFNKMIDRPHGILLVTGPTGSGKTTTLYAALNALVSPERKVLTIEDPVEYNLAGVNQIPVSHKIGLTFERGLRAILRHDPDIVMIGEIRDIETAQAATQAALTGHLVLSTLHTNDAASAATRLIEMGVEPFLVSSTVVGAMAQRLVRSICGACRVEYKPVIEDLPNDLELAKNAKLVRGDGCRTCRKTGYRGRTGLYELLTIDDDVRDKITARAPSPDIVKVARRAGMRMLREDGWAKVRAGLTTPEEVLRTTAE